MPVLKLTALLGANIGRLLLTYYVIQLSYTPLLLALSFSLVTLLASCVKLWMNSKTEEPASMELILLHSIDVIAFYLSISKVNPAAYAVITLIPFSITNVISRHPKSRLGALFFGSIGTMIFWMGTEISYIDIIIAALSSFVTLQAQNNSVRTKPSTSNSGLTEFSYSSIVLCITMLTSADERTLFLQRVTPNNTLLVFWALATFGQWICKKIDWQTSTQFTNMFIHLITAISIALLTLTDMHLLLMLSSTAVLFLSVYCSTDRSAPEDQLDVIEKLSDTNRKHNKTNSYYWLITILLIASTFILLVHINDFNTRDLQPIKPIKIETVVDFNDRNTTAAIRHMVRLQCLHKTRSAYIQLLMPYFPRGRNYTILDFPNHWNLGDAFIYVGQIVMFSVYGQVPLRPPHPHSSLIQIQKGMLNITKGTIFLHGGGNFGDIYPAADTYRTRVISAFKNTSVVMLPQSMHYKDPNRLAKMVTAYKHKDLTMMMRDYESLNYVKGNFTYAKAPFVPDSAFMLGVQLPNSDPVVDVLYLLRTDWETVVDYKSHSPKALADKHGLSSEVWDFPIHSFPLHQHKNKTLIQDMGYIFPGRLQYHKFMPSTEAITWYRTQIGNTMLSRGRVIIADRLHASVMATLIGRPVVYVDNNYRKTSRVRSSLSEFIPECTDAMLDAYYAPDIAAAIEIAADLIKKM